MKYLCTLRLQYTLYTYTYYVDDNKDKDNKSKERKVRKYIFIYVCMHYLKKKTGCERKCIYWDSWNVFGIGDTICTP